MTARQIRARAFSSALSVADWGGRATRAEVNLDVIAANVRALRRVARSRELMAVVKGDAYGHGAAAVGQIALENGASWLGVYTVGEGVRLRSAGITAPTIVFGPFERGEAADIVRHRLTPAISSLEAGQKLQDAAAGTAVAFHVKIDTGLNRSGIEPAAALPLLESLSRFPALQAQGILTHFACADEPARPENVQQLATFLDVLRVLEGAGHRFAVRHAANTGATLSLPESHLDMVRCGIGVCGYYPSEKVARSTSLRPALSLLTKVTRLHDLPAGAGIGYGHEFVCTRPTRVALAPIGYGDGLPRTLGLGVGRVIVRDRLVPIVGRISMDQITIDVTDILNVRIGDPVTIIGASDDAEHSADDLAAEAGTISYDILCGILPRVPRLYVKDGRLRAG
jgi:alanine racemase